MTIEATKDQKDMHGPSENAIGGRRGIAQRSLVWQIALPVPIVLIVFLAVGWMLIPRTINANVEQAAIDNAILSVNQYKKIRGYYTKNVIEKVLANGGVRPSIDHANEPAVLEVPQRLIRESV